jgi:hypothetical protein
MDDLEQSAAANSSYSPMPNYKICDCIFPYFSGAWLPLRS